MDVRQRLKQTYIYASLKLNTLNMLKDVNVEGKDLGVIVRVYWEQKSSRQREYRVQIEEYQKKRLGVRQGCILSSNFFSIYRENVMKLIEDLPGVAAGGVRFKNVRYTDDRVLIVSSVREFLSLLNTVIKETEKK